MIVRSVLTRLIAAVALAALTLPGAALAEESTEKESLAKGKFVLRGNAGIDLDKTINLGGDNSGQTPIAGSVNLGAGYFVVQNLSLDLDLDLRFRISPAADITSLGVTPGMRYYPIPQAYVRAGVPIVLIPNLDIGVLAGAGFRQKMVANTYFVLGIDYTYWVTDNAQKFIAPNGRIDIHAGVQAHF